MANIYKGIDNFLKFLPISDYRRKKLRNGIIVFVLKWGIIIGLPMAVIGGISEKMGVIETPRQEVKVESKAPIAPKKVEHVQQLRIEPEQEPKQQVQTQPVKVEPKPQVQTQPVEVEAKPQVHALKTYSNDTSEGIIVKRPDSNSSTIPLADLKFLEGLAVFEDPNTGLKGYVNGDGNIVIAPQFSGAGGFYQGRAVVKNKQELWGYIDKSGNWVIAPQFCMAGRFSEGLAAVYVGGMRELNGDCVQGKWGFISTTGKMVIAPQFEQVWRFDRAKNEAAKAKVVLDGYTGYINGKGEWVD